MQRIAITVEKFEPETRIVSTNAFPLLVRFIRLAPPLRVTVTLFGKQVRKARCCLKNEFVAKTYYARSHSNNM